jgi:hypothetical protein
VKEKLNFPGVPVYMNGRNYYIPSLSTRQYRENASVLENPPVPEDGEKSASYVARATEAMLPIIGIAMRRNYPDVTNDQLEDWLDGSTLMTAWQATQNASGMTPVTEGEDLPAAAELIGSASTAQ